LTVGSLFVGHGTQKLFGWWGGHGPEGTGQFFEQLGMRPGRRHALGAGTAETVGGALVALGMLTPVGAALLSGVMVTAVRKLHWKNGVWATDGGFEYNAVLLAGLAALVEQGPGKPSVDAALLPRLKGSGLAIASLAAGAAGSYLNERLLGEQSQDEPPQPQATDSSNGASAGAEAKVASEA
jgi:putative oxidoreductase